MLLPSHWAAAKGGAELQAHSLADYLARNTNHEVSYLAKRTPETCDSYSYRIMKFTGLWPQRFGMFGDAMALLRALNLLQPDLIIQRVASAYTGIAASYALRHRIKLVWHVSSDRDVNSHPELPVGPLGRFIDTRIFKNGVRNATAIVTQTRHQGKILQATYGRSPNAVIPNFAIAPPKSWKKISQFTVLWIANLKPLKQPERFVQLANNLASHDISFKIIGRQEESHWCRSILEQVARSRNVEYLGELELEEVNARLEQAHLLVNTSLFEGFPNTFIQAWLREVPTITLGVDPDGLINFSGLGYCAPSIDALTNRVLEHYRNRPALAAMGANARRFAIENFSISNAHAMVGLVDQVLNDGI